MLRSCLRTTLLLLTLLAAGFGSGRANGQDMVLVQMFGSGVHSYFAGDYQHALSDFSSAIDAGSTDPRAYYFRGLAARRMGKNADAQKDFERGAELEAKAADRFYPVSRSLERVQGLDRIALERHRAQARAVAYQEKQKREQARYERLLRAEETVLRAAPVAIPPAAPQAPAAAPAAPQPAATVDDPFAAPADDAAPKAAPQPAEEDPFGESDAPAEKKPEAPAEDDPFATGDEKPAPPAAEEDPFADDAPAGETEKKPEEPKAAEEADPFGG